MSDSRVQGSKSSVRARARGRNLLLAVVVAAIATLVAQTVGAAATATDSTVEQDDHDQQLSEDRDFGLGLNWELGHAVLDDLHERYGRSIPASYPGPGEVSDVEITMGEVREAAAQALAQARTHEASEPSGDDLVDTAADLIRSRADEIEAWLDISAPFADEVVVRPGGSATAEWAVYTILSQSGGGLVTQNGVWDEFADLIIAGVGVVAAIDSCLQDIPNVPGCAAGLTTAAFGVVNATVDLLTGLTGRDSAVGASNAIFRCPFYNVCVIHDPLVETNGNLTATRVAVDFTAVGLIPVTANAFAFDCGGPHTGIYHYTPVTSHSEIYDCWRKVVLTPSPAAVTQHDFRRASTARYYDNFAELSSNAYLQFACSSQVTVTLQLTFDSGQHAFFDGATGKPTKSGC